MEQDQLEELNGQIQNGDINPAQMREIIETIHKRLEFLKKSLRDNRPEGIHVCPADIAALVHHGECSVLLFPDVKEGEEYMLLKQAKQKANAILEEWISSGVKLKEVKYTPDVFERAGSTTGTIEAIFTL